MTRIIDIFLSQSSDNSEESFLLTLLNIALRCLRVAQKEKEEIEFFGFRRAINYRALRLRKYIVDFWFSNSALCLICSWN